jgi:hypothetical protein
MWKGKTACVRLESRRIGLTGLRRSDEFEKLGDGFQVQFFHDFRASIFHASATQIQFSGNILICFASDQQFNHISFFVSQR